jgi:cytochrome c-type biogenesis protein CcmF
VTRLLGAGSLIIALGAAIFGAFALLLGARQKRTDLLRSGELALYAMWGLVTVATLSMVYALVAHDFSVKYVAMVGSRATPIFYTVISLWGALERSSSGSSSWRRCRRWSCTRIGAGKGCSCRTPGAC